MKRNNIGYYIKEGVSSIFAHGFMSFASVFIIVACLIIMGSFVLLAVNVNAIIDKFENENVVVAFIDENFTTEQSRALESQIESIANVEYATFKTREEAMEDFESKYQDTSIFEGIDGNVLRDRYSVYVRDISLMEQTQKDLYAIEGVCQSQRKPRYCQRICDAKEYRQRRIACHCRDPACYITVYHVQYD